MTVGCLQRFFRVSLLAACVAVLLAFCTTDALAQKRVHSVFFEGSDYELNVYRIYGKDPGKTLMLIGGIQGDEPGGFLSADHYADISLAKGNLIVVPRANFHSIVLNRRKINEDMNRKFGHDSRKNYETKIVTILKELIKESDCLLNLHDGSGFFSETWVSSERNPLRFGQSIIADSETYVNPETGVSLHLGQLARSACSQMNQQITDSRHHFHFNNHRTADESSLHQEQRKSATFFALYTCGIPGFGIETSKSLSLELKVRYHNLAINAFMEHFGIVPEMPGINLEPPKLRYLVISINDTLPVVVEDGQILNVTASDTIMISHIEANYERGLTADIVNYGSINDLRKKFVINGPTEIIVRRDYLRCGRVRIEVGDSHKVVTRTTAALKSPPAPPTISLYKVRVNGKDKTYHDNEYVRLVKGDTFEIVDVIVENGDPSRLQVNFKGFVGNPENNTGEDRGYIINTGRDLWPRYSLEKKGKTYPIIIKHDRKTIGKLFVDIEDP